MTVEITQDWIEAYKEIGTLIKTEMSELKHIDLWMEQPFTEGQHLPFETPALFMEFNTSSIDDNGNGTQQLVMVVSFYLLTTNLADSHITSTTSDFAFGFGELARKLHQTLHCKAGQYFSSLSRVAIRRLPVAPYMLCYVQDYATNITDNTATKKYEQTTQPPTLKIEEENEAPPSTGISGFFNLG